MDKEPLCESRDNQLHILRLHDCSVSFILKRDVLAGKEHVRAREVSDALMASRPAGIRLFVAFRSQADAFCIRNSRKV